MINRSVVIRRGSRGPMREVTQRTFVLTAEDTHGAIEWIESTLGYGGGPPYHLHQEADQVFTVLQGEIRFKVDNEMVDLGPGDTMFIPRGVPHTFTNIHRGQPARSIGTYAPAGLEAFFRLLDEISTDGEPDEVATAELAARYGMELLGPPLAVELGLSGKPS